MLNNPFTYGNPVLPADFIGRRRELRRVVGRLRNHGQSTAIVSEPRTGKTSLLEYLAAPEVQDDLYGAEGNRLHFTYLDAHSLGSDFTRAQFWQYALSPVYNSLVLPGSETPLGRAYRVCSQNNYGTFVLERFFAQLAAAERRLILLLDEFDMLLHHPLLNCAEFFGSLRSLTSRSKGALAVVVAGRCPLTRLNGDTQHFSRTGSPYFNFLSEITLGPLSQRDTGKLLSRAGERFTAQDRRFVTALGGGHPYLLQVGASALWDADSEGLDGRARYQQAGETLYDEVAVTLGDTWRLWPPATQCAFMIAGIDQISSDWLSDRTFHERNLLRNLRDFGPELRALEKQGFVTHNGDNWDVRPQAFLWWLADEIVRLTRDTPDPEALLRAQQWDGLFTRGEKATFGDALREAGSLLKGGAKVLIETAAASAAGG